MRKLPFLLIALLAFPSVAIGQSPVLRASSTLLRASSADTGAASADVPVAIHVTDRLTNSAEGQAAIKRYHEMKAGGEFVARKTAESIGSVQGFKVRNLITNQFDEIEFTLKVQSNSFNIWVENAELVNGHVDDALIERMRAALEDSTPSGSFDSSRGIIEVDELVFGSPPDVDASGKSDVLLVDVRDGYEPGVSNGFVIGFVDPVNLTSANVRDILHIDTYPALQPTVPEKEVLQTASHEYQHLIHFGYDLSEFTFVSEGLAEFAELATGFTPRPSRYSTTLSELTQPLFNWRDGGGPGAEDYQRAGMFTTYLSERIGVLGAGSITRARGRGVLGYQEVLNTVGLSFAQTVAEFHVANVLNDRTAGDSFGYATAHYSGVSAAITATFDGNTSTNTGQITAATLDPGAVAYYSWTDVSDFNLSLDAVPGSSPLSTIRARLGSFVIGKTPNSGTTITAVEAGGEPVELTGDFEEVILVLPHTDLTLSSGPTANRVVPRFQANWSPVQSSVETETIIYDAGEIVVVSQSETGVTVDAWPMSDSALGVDAQFANVFDVPPGARLLSVDVAVLYNSQFGQTVSSTARDYTLKILSEANGGPGAELASLTRTDLSGDAFAVAFDFDRVDLSSYALDFPNGGRIFVSVANAGADDNFAVLPVSEFTGTDSPSWLYLRLADGYEWARFDALVTSGGEHPFDGRVAPIRATVALSTATDTDAAPVLPVTVMLGANYPNPFNPSTSIAYQVPSTMDVRLSVYDMLGREVAVLVNGSVPGGSHEATFDASRLSSGLYVYALQAGGQRTARTMVLVK